MPRGPIAIILGGGAGTRLFPLTKDRSKPAVPIAGKFRLIDIPISNCLNSDLYHIFILTQFNSGSLNQHVSRSFPIPHFMEGFVEVLAANKTSQHPDWYQGTADAVRQNLWYINRIAKQRGFEYALILSGDHLYRMDYRELFRFHLAQEADITVSVLPVSQQDAYGFGILQVNEELGITRFVEKPQDPELLDSLRVEGEVAGIQIPPDRPFLASMGIYIFKIDLLQKMLEQPDNDFGKEVLPKAMEEGCRLFAYPFKGYWRDIGTIRAYYEANLEMCEPLPAFDFFPDAFPFHTRARSLGPAKIHKAHLDHSLLAEGVEVQAGTKIIRSIVGLRTQIGKNVEIKESILFGSMRYEAEGKELNLNKEEGYPPLGIGDNSVLRHCIVDRDVRIGKDVKIIGNTNVPDGDYGDYYIREGLVIIPRKAVIQDGREIPGPQ